MSRSVGERHRVFEALKLTCLSITMNKSTYRESYLVSVVRAELAAKLLSAMWSGILLGCNEACAATPFAKVNGIDMEKGSILVRA
jgi:hypothetical protein